MTSLGEKDHDARALYEDVYCARGEMENRIKEQQLDLFADRTSAATMRANRLRLWFASMAYVLIAALRRIGLAGGRFADATCGTIRLKLLKIGALVRLSVRRLKVAMASSFPYQHEYRSAYVLPWRSRTLTTQTTHSRPLPSPTPPARGPNRLPENHLNPTSPNTAGTSSLHSDPSATHQAVK